MVPAVKKVEMANVSQVKWTNAKLKERPRVPPPFNQFEMDQFLQSLRNIGQLCPAMTLRAPLNSLFVPKLIKVANKIGEDDDEDPIRFRLFLVNIETVHHPEYLQYTLDELRGIAVDIQLNYSDDDTKYIEEKTRRQANCGLWFRFRESYDYVGG